MFETATLADAIKKANIVAPSRGEAFDQAGGIVLEILPEDELVIVKATNGEIFHMEWISVVSIEGDATSWRLPSKIAAPIIASLPIGTGRETVLEEVSSGVSSHLALSSGKTKAKFFLMAMDYYPRWETFDPDDLVAVPDFGGRVKMVEWAASTNNDAPLTGVNFTGELVRATDRYKIACSPLEIPNMEGGVTVPAGILGQVLKQTGEVMVGFTENQMLLMPNDTTQLRVVLYGGDYPTMTKIMDRSRPQSVTFKKNDLHEILNRAILAAPGDRLLLLHMYLGKGEIVVKVEGPETAVMDSVAVPNQADHGRFQVRLTPKLLADALSNCPNESVTLHYDTSLPERILYLNGGSGYECWIATRRPNE